MTLSAGFCSLLATIDDIDVIGEAATGATATATAIDCSRRRPLDLQMPDGHGIDATRAITTALPSVAVVILTMYEDQDSIEAAFRAGARGYLLKGASQDDVAAAIRAAARGHVVLGPGAAERLLSRLTTVGGASPTFPELTEPSGCAASRGSRPQQRHDRPRLAPRPENRRQPRLEHPHQTADRRPGGGDRPSPARGLVTHERPDLRPIRGCPADGYREGVGPVSGDSPVSTRVSATSRSLMFMCCDARRNTSNAWSAVIRSRSIRIPCACPTNSRVRSASMRFPVRLVGCPFLGGVEGEAGERREQLSLGAVGPPKAAGSRE